MSISFTEALGGPVPATEIEINLQGAGGLPSGDRIRDIVILGERLATGTSAADEVTTVPFADADAAKTWFGEGSVGHLLAEYVFDYRNGETGTAKASVYGAAVAEGAGAAPIAKLTFANAATGNGSWTLRFGGKKWSFAVANGDTEPLDLSKVDVPKFGTTALAHFQCQGCAKKFENEHQLRNHMLLMHGGQKDTSEESTRPQTVCPVWFPTKSLSAPENDQKLAQPKFPCKFCSESFATSPRLTRHINKHHPSKECRVVLLENLQETTDKQV